MAAIAHIPSNDNVSAPPAPEPEAPQAVKAWEKSGGHFPDLASATLDPSDVSLRASSETASAKGFAEMRSKFLEDFADGSMGGKHNS